jgi:hypothetical protein
MSSRGLLWRESLRRRVGGDRVAVTDGELLVLIACNLITTVGLAGDIARHLENPNDLEGDFLSSWHLVLYGGVLSVALWLGVGAIRRGPAFLPSVAPTVVGFGLLAVGGAFDALWHAQFGTEARVEALVSPPHLMVFAGLAFLLASPIIVIWRRPARRLGLVASVVVLVSVVTTVLVISLFTGFLSPLASGMSLLDGYVEPLVGEAVADYDQVRGLGITLWTTVVLTVSFVTVLVRFRPVPGLTGVAIFLCGAPAMAITDPDAIQPLVIGYAMAGLVVEVLVGLLGRPTLGRAGASAVGAGLGAMLWAATFALLAQEGRLAWSTTMWSGTVVLSGLVGAAAAAIVALPAPTGDAVVDSPLGPRPA